jgi:hypothetical protein
MSDFHPVENSTRPELKSDTEPIGVTKDANLTPAQSQNAPPSSKKLTADEQMALYEKALKEDDWGHQPC